MLFDLLRLYKSKQLTLRWNKDCANTGLIFQWRFDNCGAISLLFFFARKMSILNLRSPGVTEDLREEIAEEFCHGQVCDQSGLNVSIMVSQGKRCDKFV